MVRFCFTLFAIAAFALANQANAGDAYDNQIKMAVTLMEGSPASFRALCDGLGGTHSPAGSKAKCVRGMTTLMVAFSGSDVNFAMVAYPATPKDIRGLWDKAKQMFGQPDQAKDNELTWLLGDNIFASAAFDDEYSIFALGVAE